MGTFTITQTPASKSTQLYPITNGCNIDCFPYGDTTNYKCINNVYNALDSDDDYVFMNGASTVSDFYNIENHGTLTGTINYVKGCCRAKSDKFAPAHDFVYKVVLSKNSSCTNYDKSRIMPLNTGFTTFTNAWGDNPFTSVEWEWSDVDNLQLGFEASSPSVVASPFTMIPSANGDRIDITDVTTDYEHWEAVRAEKPLAQVTEKGAAWKYDLYAFAMADPTNYPTMSKCCGKFGDYILLSNTHINNFTYIYKWLDGKSQYLTKIDKSGLTLETDGTYYYLGSVGHIYVLEYNETTNTLSVKQDYSGTNIDGVTDIIYENGYLYTACGVGGAQVFSVLDGIITHIDTALYDGGATSVQNAAIAGSYFYVRKSKDLYAISFDGTSLTVINSIHSALLFEGLDTDGTYIYTTVYETYLRAYSFNGAIFTLLDTYDNGGASNLGNVLCTNGYIHLDSWSAPYAVRAFSFNGTTLSYVGAYTNAAVSSLITDGDGFIMTQKDEGSPTANSPVVLTFNGTDYTVVHNVENGMMSFYLDDNIASVTVIAKMGKEYDAPNEADIRGRMIIKTHSTEYTSPNYWKLEYPYKWYAYTWNVNPNTSATWTLDEVRALQAGIGLYGNGSKYAACNVCHVIVAATTNASPQIQTSQCYLEVNYSPPSNSCIITKPSEVSCDHSRNIQMLNFWSGEREVYDESRAGKNIVMAGCEIENGCTKIQCLRDMAKDGSLITISGLSFEPWNGEYRILSFRWRRISKKPDTWEWVLELEDSKIKETC